MDHQVDRKIALIFVGSGWGAPDMRTAKGAEKAQQALINIFKDEQPEIFYMNFHNSDSLTVSEFIPTEEQNLRLARVTQVSEKLSHLIVDVLKKGLFPIVIGGDHSIAIGTWSGVKLT